MAAVCSAWVAPWAHAEGDALEEWLSRSGRANPPSPTRVLVRDAAADVVIAALNFLDRPYRLGGQSVDTGFDCSGFTRHLFGQTLGINLPRRVDDQAHDRSLSRVSRNALRAGDLVFFNTLRRPFSHVGIYVGDGRFIHAPRSGARVRLERLDSDYWGRRFTGARRATALSPAAN
ncbi:MAG: C40 family peptidase [Burkholderiaceae bacterium]|nr:C40 family peptidase [Burkholderiaceae bacterium]